MVKKAAKTLPLSQEYIIDSDGEGTLNSVSTSAGRTEDRRTTKLSGTTTKDTAARKDQSFSSKSSSAKLQAQTQQKPSTVEQNPRENTDRVTRVSEIPKDPSRAASTSHSSSKRARIPAKPFQPPSGFREILPDAAHSAETSAARERNWAGKTVWHITGPTALPITAIRDLDGEALRRNRATLQYDGKDYELRPGSEISKYLLTFDNSHATYTHANVPVSKCFHIHEAQEGARQSGNHGAGSDKENRFVASAKPAPMPPPKQRESLQIQFRPFGTDVDDAPLSTDVDMDASPASPQQQRTSRSAIKNIEDLTSISNPQLKPKSGGVGSIKKNGEKRPTTAVDAVLSNPPTLTKSADKHQSRQRLDPSKGATKAVKDLETPRKKKKRRIMAEEGAAVR